jgi:hypothetical protein
MPGFELETVSVTRIAPGVPSGTMKASARRLHRMPCQDSRGFAMMLFKSPCSLLTGTRIEFTFTEENCSTDELRPS